jgi:hypothetical protein
LENIEKGKKIKEFRKKAIEKYELGDFAEG